MAAVSVIGNTLADCNLDLPSEFLHRAATEQAITLPFGMKLEANSYQLTSGGSGANVAVGLQRGGLSTRFATGLSTDALGDYLHSALNATGLHLMIDRYAEPTNLSVILRIKAERTIISAHNRNLNFLKQELPSSGWLHIAPLPAAADNFYGALVSHLVTTSQLTSFNPSMEMIEQRGRHFLLALQSLKILFVNQDEAAALARLPRRTSAPELIRALRRLGPNVVCVTCGQKGAYVGSPAGTFFVAAITNEANRVDATGAGDAFTSGFLLGYIDQNIADEGELLRQAMAFGALNAGSVVGQVGGQAGLLTRSTLERDQRTVTVKKVEGM